MWKHVATQVIAMIRASSAAAKIDKPLRAQNKAPDVYSRIRECVRDCQCNAIHLNQTCHMNSLCNQRSGCLPLASKSCFCCSETQNTCLTSWYWVVRAHWIVRAQWRLAWERRKLRFSEWIQQHRQQHWLLPLEWGLWEMIYRVKVLSLLSHKKQDCFHVETRANTSDGKLSGHLVPLLT